MSTGLSGRLAGGRARTVRRRPGSERIIYTALRDAGGVYRGVLETVVPLTEAE